jgi:hypothetical protein
MSDFSYESVQTHMAGGKTQVRNVTIKNGKGYKSVSRYCKGKCNSTVRRRLLLKDIEMIQRHQYIPALFKDCRPKNRTSRNRRRRSASSRAR